MPAAEAAPHDACDPRLTSPRRACPPLPGPQEELKETLPPHELKALLASTHRPNYVVQVGRGELLRTVRKLARQALLSNSCAAAQPPCAAQHCTGPQPARPCPFYRC